MLDKANDKNFLRLTFLKIKDEFTHIKNNWLLYLMCFILSRYCIINEIYPFAIVVLSSYCQIKEPRISILITTILAIFSVRFNFVYIVMLTAIFLFFYNFRKDNKKSVFLGASYAALVLFFSKNSILFVDGFNLNSFMLNLFETIFIFSSIVLIKESIEVVKNINKKRPKEQIHRPKANRQHAEMEIASTTTKEDSNPRFYKHSNKKRLLNIYSEKAKLKIKEQLLWQNVNVKFFEVIPSLGDSIILSVTVKTEKAPEEAEEAIALIVRNLCGVKLKCTERISATPNYYVLKFKTVKRIRIKTYVASAIKDGSTLSGDSYAYAGKADKYYTVLCDGIGSGEEAYNESNGAVTMLSRFLHTDFSEEQILKTLNSLLILKFDEERYVTFDLHVIDYGAKEVRLYKAGAAPSYILSGGTVEKIVGKSLPMGILENIEFNNFKRVIRKGDMIITISDGIIDSINLDNKKSLDRYLEMIKHKDSQTIANSILSYALRGCTNIIDDMTVLVTKIG